MRAKVDSRESDLAQPTTPAQALKKALALALMQGPRHTGSRKQVYIGEEHACGFEHRSPEITIKLN